MISISKGWFKYIQSQVKNVTFISFLKTKNLDTFEMRDYIQVYLKNEFGTRDEVLYELHTTPEKLTGDDYEFLLNKLKSGDYVKVEKPL